MANIGVDNLKANLTTPARNYMWDVLIPVPIGGGDFSTFQIRVQSSEIPQVSTTSHHIDYKQTAGIEIAGKKSYTHSWNATFIESEDRLTYDACYAWTQQVVNDALGIGVGDPFYKTDVYLELLKVEDGTPWMKIRLKGAWIKTIGSVNLDYSQDGTIRYPVTFSFDSFEKVA